MIDRRRAVFGPLILSLSARAAANAGPSGCPRVGMPVDGVETIDLWPKGPPGLVGTPPVETVEERSKNLARPDRSVRGIARPRMAVFRPARSNGAAMLVMPGGGYRNVVVDKEGHEVACRLAGSGYTVFVLLYRLPGEGWADRADVPLQDAQRAMRLIRASADRFGIAAGRVGAMGFSAGGHLCGDLATRHAAPVYAPQDAADRLDARPAIFAPIYAVQSMDATLAHPGSRAVLLGPDPTPALERAHSTAANVTAATPPCFLVHAEDDPTVDVGNTLAFRAACRAAGVPVETHLFERGGHGFGLRMAPDAPVAQWPTLFDAWARAHGVGQVASIHEEHH